MVANVLQVAPQGKGKKSKKLLNPQDKIQAPKVKNSKIVSFSILLNEKTEKTQKSPKEISQTPSKKTHLIDERLVSHEKKMQTKDMPQESVQKSSKIKKSKNQEVQTNIQQPLPVVMTQNFAPKVEVQEKKGVKKPALTSLQPSRQSTQEQLALHTPKKAIKPTTPLKEVLQTPMPLQKREQKTLGDVAKLAQNLNLTKLELKGDQKPLIQSKKEEEPKISSKSVKTPTLQTLLAKNSTKSNKTQENPKLAVKENIREENSITPEAQELPKESKLKDVSLGELLKNVTREKNTQSVEEKNAQEEKKSEKPQELQVGELKREVQFKLASSKETFTQFSQRIREEILNYKPPFSKLTMELNPVELGKLEITITKKGKELVVNVNANNANALHTFMQNQSEFRSTLSSVGFSNVELNFSQGEGRGGGGQPQEREQQKRNKNSLGESITEIPALASMEIKMVQYA